MSDWTWKPCRAGDKYCISPIAFDGSPLPYTVAKIITPVRVVYETWHRGQVATYISGHATAEDAKQAAVNHWIASR